MDFSRLVIRQKKKTKTKKKKKNEPSACITKTDRIAIVCPDFFEDPIQDGILIGSKIGKMMILQLSIQRTLGDDRLNQIRAIEAIEAIRADDTSLE